MSSERTKNFITTHWLGLSLLGWFILLTAASAMFLDQLLRASR
jgi:hypothetical protein